MNKDILTKEKYEVLRNSLVTQLLGVILLWLLHKNAGQIIKSNLIIEAMRSRGFSQSLQAELIESAEKMLKRLDTRFGDEASGASVGANRIIPAFMAGGNRGNKGVNI